MATNLNFKMGPFTNLPAASANTAGTVYVTTDEKAMYVDVPKFSEGANPTITKVDRIRLGQIIIWNETEWAEAKPPFSTEAFYYVTGHNALLRYNGTNWIQINSTSDLKIDISHIETLLSYKGVFEKAPTNPASGDIYYDTSNKGYYRYNGTSWVTYSGIGAEINRIDSVDTKVTTIESTYATKTYADGKAKEEAEKILGQSTDTSTNNTVYGVKKYVTEVLGKSTDAAGASTVYGANAAAAAAQSTASTAATAAANAQAKANSAYDLAATKTTMADVVKQGYATVTQLNTAKTAILGTTTENGTTKDFNGTVKGAYDKADTNATAIANLQTSLQVADALVYQGIVTGAYNTENETTTLTFSNTSTPKKGSTYKAINEFILDKDQSSTNTAINIYIGDLLIATGTEDATTGFITTNSLKWDHIPSGYVAEYVPEMSIDGVSDNATTLQLTSAHADTNEKGDLGEIQIKGTGNINLTSVPGSNNASVGVEFSLVWGTF